MKNLIVLLAIFIAFNAGNVFASDDDLTDESIEKVKMSYKAFKRTGNTYKKYYRLSTIYLACGYKDLAKKVAPSAKETDDIITLDISSTPYDSNNPQFMLDVFFNAKQLVGVYTIGLFEMSNFAIENQRESICPAMLEQADKFIKEKTDLVKSVTTELNQVLEKKKNTSSATEKQNNAFIVNCKQPLPEFTLGKESNPNQRQVDDLCDCVWNNLTITQRNISKKISEKNVQTQNSEIKKFISVFGTLIDNCGGKQL